MLTSLRIKNFKAWRDTGQIRLAPLTVIFGANSAGKSSIGHLLLALKQTVLSTDRKRALHLGDENALIDLGTFVECLHKKDKERELFFEVGWKIPGNDLKVTDPLTKKNFSGNEINLGVSIAADSNEQPVVNKIIYRLFNSDENFNTTYERKPKNRFDITSDKYEFKRNTGRVWELDEPDKFYRISDQSRARFQNAEFLSDFALNTEAALNSIYYLGPLREHPKRLYSWSGETPESVGQKGEFTIPAILAATQKQRKLNRGRRMRLADFQEFIAGWLQDLGIISSFEVKPVAKGRKEFEVWVKTHLNSTNVKITDVGFGVSQVLPALVQAFYAPPNSTIWMEQPEIHLHPQVQAELADVFISATQAYENNQSRNVQLIVESHSEHFLNRLLRRVAEGKINPEDLAIYFCHREGSAAELEELCLDMLGNIKNWPENFFGNTMADIAGRSLAAMERKKKDSAAKGR